MAFAAGCHAASGVVELRVLRPPKLANETGCLDVGWLAGYGPVADRQVLAGNWVWPQVSFRGARGRVYPSC